MLRKKIIGMILLCHLYNVTEEKEILFLSHSNKSFCFDGRVNVVLILMLLNMEKHIRKLCRQKYFLKRNINYCLKLLQIYKNFR